MFFTALGGHRREGGINSWAKASGGPSNCALRAPDGAQRPEGTVWKFPGSLCPAVFWSPEHVLRRFSIFPCLGGGSPGGRQPPEGALTRQPCIRGRPLEGILYWTLRVANRPPTPTSKTIEAPGPFDDIWRSRATVPGRFWGFRWVRTGLNHICASRSKRPLRTYTPGFLIPRLWAGRKSSIFEVWAAPKPCIENPSV